MQYKHRGMNDAIGSLQDIEKSTAEVQPWANERQLRIGHIYVAQYRC